MELIRSNIGPGMLVLSSLHVAHAVTLNPRENWPSPSVATHHIAGYFGSAGLQLENHGLHCALHDHSWLLDAVG